MRTSWQGACREKYRWAGQCAVMKQDHSEETRGQHLLIEFSDACVDATVAAPHRPLKSAVWKAAK